MGSMVEDGDMGLEEGMLWLPVDALGEACEPKEILGRRQHHQHLLNTSSKPVPRHSFSKSGSKLHNKPRYPANWASGMRAIFLDSGQRSCGTGFFLPQREGVNLQTSKKPACSPVLLPSRVIQALNLNVHALGSQLILQRDLNINPKKGGRDSFSNKNGNDVLDGVSSQRCVYSQAGSSTREIFLPKEWSY